MKQSDISVLAFNWKKMVLINTVFYCHYMSGLLLQLEVLVGMSNDGLGGLVQYNSASGCLEVIWKLLLAI